MVVHVSGIPVDHIQIQDALDGVRLDGYDCVLGTHVDSVSQLLQKGGKSEWKPEKCRLLLEDKDSTDRTERREAPTCVLLRAGWEGGKQK